MSEIEVGLGGSDPLMESPGDLEPPRRDAPGVRRRLLVGALALVIAGAGVAGVWGLRALGNDSRTARPGAGGTPCPGATTSLAVQMDPRSGPAGSDLDLSGFVSSYDKAGQYHPNTVRVSFWWGLGQDEWVRVLSSPGDRSVLRLAEADVADRCAYAVRAIVPDVPPGQYPITGIYFSDDGGAATLGTEIFTVTAG